VGDVDYGFE
jgi:hypothetical protein